MNGSGFPLLVGAIVSLGAIAAATVAVALGHIDGATFAGLVGGFGGAGVGVGAHAAGTKS